MDRIVFVGIAVVAVLALAFTAASVDTSIEVYDPTPPEDSDGEIRSEWRQAGAGSCSANASSEDCDRNSSDDSNESTEYGTEDERTETSTASIWQIIGSVVFLSMGGLILLYGLTRGDGVQPATEDTDTESYSETGAGTTPFNANIEPANDVHRAWLALCEQVDTASETASPAAIAATAVEQGFDERAVQNLCREFCAIRYGDRKATERREQRVRKAATELGLLEGEE